MKAGRIVMIVIGALLALMGFGLLAGGTAGVIAVRHPADGRVLPDR